MEGPKECFYIIEIRKKPTQNHSLVCMSVIRYLPYNWLTIINEVIISVPLLQAGIGMCVE